MSPIEALWGTLIVVFVLVGLVRGFLRELGVTTVLIVLLFGYDRVIPFLEGFINNGGLLAMGAVPLDGSMGSPEPTQRLLWLVFTIITIAVVFISYQGETLTYQGTNPRFPVGALLSALVGLINGYLVTGTLWWFLNRYGYPTVLGFSNLGNLTDFARSIVDNKLLPLDLLGNGGVAPASGFGSIWLPLILVVLVILKVLR